MTPKKRKKELGENQRRLLEILAKFQSENGYPPSIRDLVVGAKISSTSMVNYYLDQLQEWGYIEREEHTARSIRLALPLTEIIGLTSERVKQAVQATKQAIEDILRVPIMGRIFAAAPVPVPASDFAYYDVESFVDVARSMLPAREKGDDLFALEVQGDSMIDAMVNDGDYVIMKRAKDVNNGEMVAVWLKDREETTLKYLFKEEGRVRLQPANPTMQPIIINDPSTVEIQGKVVMVIRQVETVN